MSEFVFASTPNDHTKSPPINFRAPRCPWRFDGAVATEKNAKIPKTSFGTAKAFFLEISPLFWENQGARAFFCVFQAPCSEKNVSVVCSVLLDVPRCCSVFLGVARCCSVLLGVPRCPSVFLSLDVLGVARCCSELLGVPRCCSVWMCSVLFGVPRCCSVLLGVPRCCSVLLSVLQCCSVFLGVPRCCSVWMCSVFLGVARCSSVLLGVPRCSCVPQCCSVWMCLVLLGLDVLGVAWCSSVLLRVPQCCSWSVCLAATFSAAGSLRMKWNNSRKTFRVSRTTSSVFLRLSPSQRRHQNAKSHTRHHGAPRLIGRRFCLVIWGDARLNSDIDFKKSRQFDLSKNLFSNRGKRSLLVGA